jgi:ferric-dicitrate binding protein FerR (iron transport regulator)
MDIGYIPEGVLLYLHFGNLAVEDSVQPARLALTEGQVHCVVNAQAARPLQLVVKGGWLEAKQEAQFVADLSENNLQLWLHSGSLRLHRSVGESLVLRAPLYVPYDGTSGAVEMHPYDTVVLPVESWEGALVFNTVSLLQVITLLNTHTTDHYDLTDDTLGQLPISGQFYVQEVERFAELLEKYGLQIEEKEKSHFYIGRRPAAVVENSAAPPTESAARSQ